jgi:hypothetical protein
MRVIRAVALGYRRSQFCLSLLWLSSVLCDAEPTLGQVISAG